jgi:hypothetical protein
MTKEQINNRALELYPIKPYPVQCKDFNRVETVDLNEAARNAFIKGCEESFIYDHLLVEQSFKNGVQKGKNEILKKLPKWKKATRDIECDTLDFIVKYNHDGGDDSDWESCVVTNRLKNGESYIEIEDLMILDSE